MRPLEFTNEGGLCKLLAMHKDMDKCNARVAKKLYQQVEVLALELF